jgi:hypothetical protein
MDRPMSSVRHAWVALACLCALAAPVGTFAQDATLQYQPRGNRTEGLRTIAVGGFDIELLSARIEPTGGLVPEATPSPWSDSALLRFYLPGNEKVFVTVRQLRSRTTYYWLNNVTDAFKPGAVNNYGWPTEPVLRRLKDVRPNDLGAIVRLGEEQAGRRERVLPALLSDGTSATAGDAYRFVLKTNGRANVQAAIFSGDTELYRRPANWEAANSPFTIRWESAAAAEGWYRLVLSGYFADSSPVDKVIEFYHRPASKDAAPARP